MSDHVTRSDEPINRLTHLCEVLIRQLETELQHEDPEGSPVKIIIFLEDGDEAGIVTGNYDDTNEALASLLVHLKAMFHSMGKDMQLIAMPPGMVN